MPVHHKTVNEAEPNHAEYDAHCSRLCGYLPMQGRFTRPWQDAKVAVLHRISERPA